MIDYIFWFIAITIIAKFFVRDNLRRGYKISIVLGIWVILKLFNYIAIVELIKINLTPFRGFSDFPEVDTLKYVLLGVVVAEFGFLHFIRKRIVKKLQEGDLKKEEIVNRLLILSCIIYALCESIAIFGLILFLLAGNSLNFYIFLILCFVCFGIYFPRYGQWKKWAPEEIQMQVSEQETSTHRVLHSVLGISSFVIAIVDFFGWLVLVFIVASRYQSLQSNEGVTFGLLMLAMWLICFLSVVGITLGIAGVLQRTKKRIFSALGLAGSALSLVLFVLLFLIGTAQHSQ